MTDSDPRDLDNPQRWECTSCSHAFYDSDGWTTWYCSECGSEMEPTAPEGYIAKDDLRALIAEWRDAAEWADGKEACSQVAVEVARTHINELEELL